MWTGQAVYCDVQILAVSTRAGVYIIAWNEVPYKPYNVAAVNHL